MYVHSNFIADVDLKRWKKDVNFISNVDAL